MLAYLKERSIEMATGPRDSPACRGCSIRDPDGSEIILHARKQGRPPLSFTPWAHQDPGSRTVVALLQACPPRRECPG
ncbi:MAG: hypothetical protein ABIL09_27555 [Gemmatimonadota bacterium]